MTREIVKDEAFLAQKAEECTRDDLWLAQDLKDTLSSNKERCVGLAANMLGVNKCALVAALDDGTQLVMFNPEIISFESPYMTEEGCLSLQGVRKCMRYRKITVSFLNERFRPKVREFSGFEAEIIQHEVDHTKGIII